MPAHLTAISEHAVDAALGLDPADFDENALKSQPPSPRPPRSSPPFRGCVRR